MKILSIRLHPFGGTTDRTFTLNDGLNVLEGPNEFGKSTLSKALWHAIFTPTNLTPSKLEKAVGRWYPQPHGDHVRVTLRFDTGGRTWSLEKTWGAGSRAQLQADGGAPVANPSRVQEQLDALRKLDEATWRYVLFTNQTELARTVMDIRQNAHQLDDMYSLLKGAAAIPGDIAPEKLLAALEDRIEAHFSRWTIGTGGPERGRGIDNPWQNRLGPVVKACYAQEATRRERDEVLRHEREVDAVNARIARLQEAIKADAAFVSQGNDLRDGLGRRAALEEKCARLTEHDAALMRVVTAWPGAQQVIDSKQQELARIGETLSAVDKEWQHANQRAQAEQFRNGHLALTAAKKAWEEACKTLAATATVDEQLLQELKDLERKLQDLDIKIAAQKLAAKLECRTSLSVTMQCGTDAPKTVALSPATPWEGAAAGRFRVEAGDLILSVQSGQDDVDVLFEQQSKTRARRDELLSRMGKENLAAATEAYKEHRELVRMEANRKGLYQSALQGKTLEQWTAEMAALTALPQTRDLATLNGERSRLLTQQADLNAAIAQYREQVRQWSEEHGDVTQLMSKILASKSEKEAAVKELESLPVLPEGYNSVGEYLTLLKQKQQAQSELHDKLQAEKLKHAGLVASTPERTAEDLRDELELAEREFQRRLEEGEALLRIRAKLNSIIDARGDSDPLQGLANAISNHFSLLTEGRYTAVQLADTVPVRVDGAAALDATWLSQGTLGSLALATRLALAELYLAEDEGFIMLDDPFTDMDPARRAAAAKAIGVFAQERQVLLFTCDPRHGEHLTVLAGAEAVLYTTE